MPVGSTKLATAGGTPSRSRAAAMLTGSVTLDEAVENASSSASPVAAEMPDADPRDEAQQRHQHEHDVQPRAPTMTIIAYVARLHSRSRPERSTVTAIRIPTATAPAASATESRPSTRR